MAKIIYKSVGLVLIFIGALWFFGRGLETNYEVDAETVVLSEETFPVLTPETFGYEINPLYGYAASMDRAVVRESMTPIDESKTITLHISNSSSKFTELSYSIADKESKEIYDTGSVKGFTPGTDEVKLIFSYALSTSTEYILDISGVMTDGREVHYYTRLKYYLDDSNFEKKMSFVNTFHKNSFKKSKMEDIARYLEKNEKTSNTTLAKVSITSSSDLVTWAGMTPNIISDEYITVTEYNMETACMQYNYFITANTNSGEETYHIKEFYRVRYAAGQNYLLNFERTMEAAFDPALANQSASQLKAGITNRTDGKLLAQSDGRGLYFSRCGKLYYC